MATRDEPTNATRDPAGKPPRTDKKPRTDKHPRTRLDPDVRRAAILEAAMELFAERPYTEVPIASIARQAGASDALVYRYFAGKDELYAEVVRRAIGRLGQRQAEVLEALPAGVPTRDRVRAATLVYLDYVAEHPASWATPFTAPGAEPGAAAAERAQARADYVERLRDLLRPTGGARHEYSLWGYFGFLDAACFAWVQAGSPDHDRHPIGEAALGALEGALGDWGA